MRAPGGGHPGPTAPWASSSVSGGGMGRAPPERTGWRLARHPGLGASGTGSGPAGGPGAPLIKACSLGQKRGIRRLRPARG